MDLRIFSEINTAIDHVISYYYQHLSQQTFICRGPSKQLMCHIVLLVAILCTWTAVSHTRLEVSPKFLHQNINTPDL